MSKKTADELLNELKAEAASIKTAMKKAGDGRVVAAVEAVADEITEEIIEDSSSMMKKIKSLLPDRQTAFHVIKIIVYWEAAKLLLGVIL